MASQVISFNGMKIKFCIDEQDSNGALTMFECIIDAGTKMPVPHYHKDFDETIYGIEGTVSYMVDGKQIAIGPGDSCFIQRGIVHGFSNETNETIKFLAVISPGIFGPRYFEEIAGVINAGGPPDLEKVKQIMDKHGLVPVVGR